jgi:enoyl-CoA hydratase
MRQVRVPCRKWIVRNPATARITDWSDGGLPLCSTYAEIPMNDEAMVLIDRPIERVGRITLNRPSTRNAQNTALLYALNEAFDELAAAEDVRVILLAASGPHFSSGHDIYEADPFVQVAAATEGYRQVGTWSGYGRPGAEGYLHREMEIYAGFCERWRGIPKPTIAQVHGKVIAGGLMLVWPCDLIVASDDALFCDNTVNMNMNGVEWFGHVSAFGVRKAKEMLFTGEFVTAQEAHRLGMVNHVVPRSELEATTLDLARRIAAKPTFALSLIKESVNNVEDTAGRLACQRMHLANHHLLHWHNHARTGSILDPAFFEAESKRPRSGK